MEQTRRIDQNREHTKALLTRRLLQSHRQHKAVAEKVIARRRAIRYVRNGVIATPILLALMWLTLTWMGLGIARLDAPASAEATRFQSRAIDFPAPTEATTLGSVEATDLPPVAAGDPAPLRFESVLPRPSTIQSPEI